MLHDHQRIKDYNKIINNDDNDDDDNNRSDNNSNDQRENFQLYIYNDIYIIKAKQDLVQLNKCNIYLKQNRNKKKQYNINIG